MAVTLRLGEITVDVRQRDIKHLHLTVHPPEGRVRIAAPLRMKLDTIRVYAVSKLAWIKQQQRKLREQAREAPRECIDRESHYVWGRRCLLKVVEVDAAPAVELRHTRLTLRVRPGASREQKQAVMAQWYRDQIKAALPELLSTWEPRLGVRSEHAFVQKMRTKWGAVTPLRGTFGSTRTWLRSQSSAWSTCLCTSWFICWSRPITRDLSR